MSEVGSKLQDTGMKQGRKDNYRADDDDLTNAILNDFVDEEDFLI